MMEKDKPLGIKDVANLSNVGIATVDRVIHGRPGVSKKTRDKVLKVIEELNYKPNVMASNLSKMKIYTFGILLPKASEESSYWELPIKGINKAKKELEQYSIRIQTFLYDRNSRKNIKKQILNVINSNIDGLVLTPKFKNETDILLQDCAEKNIPYVFIDSTIEEKNPLCSIQQPLYESGLLAAQLFNYCFDDGEILILYIKDAMDTMEIIKIKEKGIIDYLNEEDTSISIRKVVIDNWDVDNINDLIKITLAKMPKVKGIFIPNSKIRYVAKFFAENPEPKKYLIGYDLLKENLEFVEKRIIDFLICQNPEEQGYNSIYNLFENIVLKREVSKEIVMPLDIITKYNYKYYSKM